MRMTYGHKKLRQTRETTVIRGISWNHSYILKSWAGQCNHHHHWLDSPMSALAFFRSFCQLSFSIAKFLQFFTPSLDILDHIIFPSQLTPSNFPYSYWLGVTFLTVLLLSIGITWTL
jgi:hypothetical protein